MADADDGRDADGRVDDVPFIISDDADDADG
jgi:hypothetical protein